MNIMNGELRSVFNRMSVGFDDRWFPHENQSTFPPYNLIEVEDNKYRIEIAVAGFSKDTIQIFEEDNKLTIVGRKQNSEEDNTSTLQYNGLAQRSFTRCFNLAPNVEVTEASLEDGILTLHFYKDAHKNRRTVEIT
jgi:molecular chaperone IbpA